MDVTTIRFHADTWAVIVAESNRLGIARAEYVRCAVLLHLGQRQAEDRVARLENRHGALAERVGRVARVVARVAEGVR